MQEARTYFNCPTLIGAPLEDDGGSGTAGSHWEKASFGNEVMTGETVLDYTYSRLTMKTLEGSGWYLPDYTFAETLVWGKSEGCAVAQAECPTTGTVEFCAASDTSKGT